MLLEEAVFSFLNQDYGGAKELLILNDFTPQRIVFSHPEVTVVNVAARFPSLGEKRNAGVALCRHDLIAVWDDDDIYLPHRLSLSASRYDSRRRFFKPARSFTLSDGVLSGPKHNVFHSSSLYHRSLFEEVGGYPHIWSGEDQGIEAKFRALIGGRLADDSLAQSEAFYMYRWGGTNSYHVSAFGRGVDNAMEHARRALAEGRIRSGEIRLRPHWSRDYPAMVREHLIHLSIHS